MKKPPSKVAHNRPRFLFSLLAWLPKRPKNRNPVPPKAPNAGPGLVSEKNKPWACLEDFHSGTPAECVALATSL